MSSQAAARPRTVRSVSKGVYRSVEGIIPRPKKRRQPTADIEPTLVLSSSAPSLRAAAAIAASPAPSPPLSGERAVMATICAIIASTPLNSPTPSSTSSASSPPPSSDPAVTAAVVLPTPARWLPRIRLSSKRSKAPVLASPFSQHSHDSFGDWMPQQDGASPASSTSSSQATQPAYTHAHMHRRSSLPCFPFPASSFPASPTSSGSSVSSSSNHSFAPLPSEPSRLQSAPSAIRNLSRSVAKLDRSGDSKAANTEVAVVSSVNRFENLQLRLAAHPAIQRLQQLETHSDELQVDSSDEEEVAEVEEQSEQQTLQQQANGETDLSDSPALSPQAEMVSGFSLAGLPVVDEAEHAPLAGLVTAFPFVQQFIPQPSRAEKKKQFIQRIHATHQLTIHNNYPTTAASMTRPPLMSQSTFQMDDLPSPHLPSALPTPFRSISSTHTVSSDDSHEELSSEHDSCSQADCSSAALADTFASLSPNFISSRSSTGFNFSSPAPSAPFFLSPALSSSVCPLPLPVLQSPAFRSLPPVFTSPAQPHSYDSSMCPDELQLGERAWDDGGHWMGDW